MLAESLQGILRRALASGLSLLGTSYLARSLPRDELGAYVGQLALGQLLAGAAALGLDAAPVYLMRRYPGQARRIWRSSTWLGVGVATALVLLAALLQLLGTRAGALGSSLTRWGLVPAAYAGTYLLLQSQWACLQGLLRLGAFNVLQVLHPLAFLAGVAALDRLGGGLTPQATLLAWTSVNLGGAALAFALVAWTPAPAVSAGPEGDAPSLRRAFASVGAGSYLANLLGQLNARLPGILAAGLLAPEASGLFAGVLILVDVFSFFSFAVASVAYPMLAGRAPGADRSADLSLACRLTAGTTALAVATFLLLFRPLSHLLLGARFAVQAFLLLCAGPLLVTVVHATARILCTDFAARGRPAWNAALNVPATVVFAALFWPLHGSLGAWAAALASGGANLVFAALVFLVHRGESRLRLVDVLVPRRDDLLRLRALIGPPRTAR